MLVDTHAHVSDPAFDADRAEVLARARAAGVTRMIDVGIDVDTSRRAVRTAAREEGVFAAVGMHPHEGDRVDDATMAAIERLCAEPRVVAVGETGLDFYRNRSSREGQERALRAHLDLAARRVLPVILHLRSSATAGDGATDAYEACADVLADYAGRVTGVAHCFSGTPALAERFAALGFYVSFAGNATYPKAQVLRDAARAVPLDRLLVETDCPYLAPQPWRGKRNEPAFVATTAAVIAGALGIGPAEVAARSTANAERLFGLGGGSVGGSEAAARGASGQPEGPR